MPAGKGDRSDADRADVTRRACRGNGTGASGRARVDGDVLLAWLVPQCYSVSRLCAGHGAPVSCRTTVSAGIGRLVAPVDMYLIAPLPESPGASQCPLSPPDDSLTSVPVNGSHDFGFSPTAEAHALNKRWSW